MRLRWRLSAISDLAHIRDYIAADSPWRAEAWIVILQLGHQVWALFPQTEHVVNSGFGERSMCLFRGRLNPRHDIVSLPEPVAQSLGR